MALVPDNPQDIKPKPHLIPKNSDREVDNWNNFICKLPRDACRYFVYKILHKTGAGDQWKNAFITWIPERASTQQINLYTKHENFVTRQFGVFFAYEASNLSELSYDIIVEWF